MDRPVLIPRKAQNGGLQRPTLRDRQDGFEFPGGPRALALLVRDMEGRTDGGRVNVSVYCQSERERDFLERYMRHHKFAHKFEYIVESGRKVPRG